MAYPTRTHARAGPLHPALALHHRLYCRAHAAVAVSARHRGLVQSARGGRTHRDGARRSGGGRESHHQTVRKIARLGGPHHHRAIGDAMSGRATCSPCRAYRLGFHLGRRRPRRHQLPRHPGRVRSHRQTGRRPRLPGRAGGTSPAHDIAVLKIGVGFKRPPSRAGRHQCRPQGGSEGVRYRQPSAWTGRSPLVSSPRSTARCREKRAACHRSPDVQTDAAINPGNSGGSRCSIRLGG